jgi:selenocysteine lyase/cysteine desulfurase
VLDPHHRRWGGWISRPADRIAGGAGRALRHSDRVDPDRLDVPALRAATPGCVHQVHLNNAGAALLARPTLEAVMEHLHREALLGGYEAADAARDDIAATYARLATLVGGRADEIALFDNATRAWNAAFYAVRLRPGDRILTGRAEYGSNVLAYLQVAQRTGAEVVVVPDDESGQLDVAALADLIDERTRLIGISHVPTDGGLVNPAAEIGRVARAAGVLYLLDATQSVGQFPLDVEEIGCDLLTATGRKFLRGPRGTGFLWVRSAALDRLDPHVVEVGSADWDGHRGFVWKPGARRFATWEHSYANVLGLSAAAGQALDLGLDAIGARTLALGAALRDRLDALPHVTTHDRGATRCAIVTALVDELPAEEVAARLRARGVNVSITVPRHTWLTTDVRPLPPLVRLSPHYYNTEDEIDRAAAELAVMAR